MAVGINPVRRPQQQQRRGVDPVDRDLNRILAAVQIGQSIFGIKEQIDASDLTQERITTEQARQKEIGASTKFTETKTRETEGKIATQETAGQAGLRREQEAEQRSLEMDQTRATIASIKSRTNLTKQQKINAKKEFDLKQKKHNDDVASKTFDSEHKLRGQFSNDPKVRDIIQRDTFINNFKGLWAKYQKDPNSLSSIDKHSMVISYMKSMEPTSAVLGGEFDTLADRTRGLFSKFLDAPEKFQEGLILNDEQVRHIADTVSVMDRVHSTAKQQVTEFYNNIAKKNNLDPTQIVSFVQSGEPITTTGGQQQQQQGVPGSVEEMTREQKQKLFNKLQNQ